MDDDTMYVSTLDGTMYASHLCVYCTLDDHMMLVALLFAFLINYINFCDFGAGKRAAKQKQKLQKKIWGRAKPTASPSA